MYDLLSFVFLLTLLISASCEAQEIIYFQAANNSVIRDVKHGLHFANFIKYQFKYLQVTPFISSLMPNEKKCQVWCVQNLQCLSLNVAVFPDSDGKFRCELLATDIFNSSSSITNNENYNHYSLKTKCHDEPCDNNGTCFPIYETNTYSCQCQCPYYGYNCEKVLAQTWSTWSNCTFDLRCPDYARKRVKTYDPPDPPFANPCADNAVLETEIQNCSTTTPTGCGRTLGMQDGRILDSQITASSYYGRYYEPWLARLHRAPTVDHGCWAAESLTPGEYLQIDLGEVKTITKVATQGRVHVTHAQYITKYSLAYSENNVAWVDYPGNACVKEFPGNYDTNTVVTNVLEIPIKARYVRIVMKDFYAHPTLRCELYGC